MQQVSLNDYYSMGLFFLNQSLLERLLTLFKVVWDYFPDQQGYFSDDCKEATQVHF